MKYAILLIKFKGKEIEKEYSIAHASTEHEADKTAKFYSKLYQAKGLYHVLNKPTHIVTYKAIQAN